MRVKKSEVETFYSVCRLLICNPKICGPMIECFNCKKWFHTNCVRVDLKYVGKQNGFVVASNISKSLWNISVSLLLDSAYCQVGYLCSLIVSVCIFENPPPTYYFLCVCLPILSLMPPPPPHSQTHTVILLVQQ